MRLIIIIIMVATYIAHRSAKLALMALYIIYEHREVKKKKKKKSEKRSGPFFSLLKTWKTEKLRPKRRSWQVCITYMFMLSKKQRYSKSCMNLTKFKHNQVRLQATMRYWKLTIFHLFSLCQSVKIFKYLFDHFFHGGFSTLSIKRNLLFLQSNAY